MNARIKTIISQVRLRLGKTSTADLENGEIIALANYAQTRLMMELGLVEKSYQITLVDGTESYDFLSAKIHKIVSIFTSWEEDITIVPVSNWAEYQLVAASNPQYMTFFDNKIYFAPIPGSDPGTVTVWARQITYETPISETNDPETPEYADECIILGVLSIIDPKRFAEEYFILKNTLFLAHHGKSAIGTTVGGDW